MANSYTTTYSLTKPEVGAAEDQWGDLLNANLDAIDDLLDGTTAVTGIDINSGTIDGVTIGGTAAPTVTNIDINGGTIDGTVIGGTTPAAVTATALTATTSATLQHSASTKLATTSTGVDVTGTVTADGLTVDSNIVRQNGTLPFYLFMETDTTDLNTQLIQTEGQLRIRTVNDAITTSKERLRIDHATGDISFYEDTGTTPKFFWDASTERLGIGNAAPATALDVTGTITADGLTSQGTLGNWSIDSQGVIQTFTRPSTSYIRASDAAGNIGIQTGGSKNSALFSNNGDISFYEDTGTTPKFFWDASTERLGIGNAAPATALDVTGTVTADGLVVDGTAKVLGTAANTLIIADATETNGYQLKANTSASVDYGFLIENLAGKDLLKVEAIGDISFFEDTGTTPKFFWDASAQALGIGTTSPDAELHVEDATGNAVVQIESSATGFSGVFLGDVNDGDVGQIRYDHSDNSMRFGTNAVAERLRIDASGNLLVGKTSASTTGAGIYMNPIGYMPITRAGTSGATYIQIVNDNGTIGSITGSGTTTSYNTSSDYRLKEDVQPMVGASDRVLALKPSNFAWKADGSRTDGFIAHEVQEVAPYAVTGEKDGEEMQAMDHSKLVPLLTAALQEALTEIAALKARLAAANL